MSDGVRWDSVATIWGKRNIFSRLTVVILDAPRIGVWRNPGAGRAQAEPRRRLGLELRHARCAGGEWDRGPLLERLVALQLPVATDDDLEPKANQKRTEKGGARA